MEAAESVITVAGGWNVLICPWTLVGQIQQFSESVLKLFFKGVIYFYAPFLYAKLTVSHIIAESVSKVLSRADPWS